MSETTSQGQASEAGDAVGDLLREAGAFDEDRARERIRGAIATALEAQPIDVLLFCPQCGHQHIDAPEPESGWTNPPHKSHLCHLCKLVWRPSDHPTNGVASLLSDKDTVWTFDAERLATLADAFAVQEGAWHETMQERDNLRAIVGAIQRGAEEWLAGGAAERMHADDFAALGRLVNALGACLSPSDS